MKNSAGLLLYEGAGDMRARREVGQLTCEWKKEL